MVGHLLSISKQEGQVTSVLDYEEGWLAPIAADDERVIVFAMSSQELGFYQVPLDHPRLEALALGTARSSNGSASAQDRVLALMDLFLAGRMVGDQVYWVSPLEPPYGLLHSRFDDAEPELLAAPSPGDLSLIGPGYMLREAGAIDSAQHYVGLDFELTDDSGCRSVPGPRGERLGAVALDAKHAYWSGYRTTGSDGSSQQTLHRVALETGAVARLNAPSLPSDYNLQFVAQDDTHLLLWSNGALLSLRKP